jgi:hypothetical protein
MRDFLVQVAKVRGDVARELNKLPLWVELVRLAARFCAPVVGLARGALRVLPPLRYVEWLLEIESLTRRHPLPLALSMLYVIWRGLHTTPLGHIGTDPMIYPFLATISGFNPFLGIVCGGLFGVGDLAQKLVWPDMYGARGWGDLNYWGGMLGYVVAYSSLMFMGVLPGLLSRVFRALIRVFLQKVVFARRAAAADGALPLDAGAYPLAEMIAGMAGGAVGGFVVMHQIAPVTESPAFIWRPHPDISCRRLEIDTLLKGRATVGAEGGAVGGVATTLVPPPGGPPPDIEWTGPDGVTRVLVWHPEHNAYVNILTGGLVDPNDIEGWKQNITGNLQQTQDWRDRNQALAAAGQDAQSQALAAIQKDAGERAKILDNLGAIEKSVMFGGAASILLQPPGTPGNILDSIAKLADDVASGKQIDRNKLNAITKLYRNSASGQILPPGQLPQPGDADKGVWAEGLKSTFMDVATCTNENGFSWKGMIVRAGVGIVTLGFSEVPIALGTMKQYVDQGGNSILGGFVKGVEGVVVGEIIGFGFGKVIKGAAAGGRVIGEAAGEVAGELGGVIKAAAQAGNSVAKGLVKAASVASEGAGSLYNGVVKPVTGAIRGVADVLTTEIKVPGSSVAGEAVGEVIGTASKAEGAAAAAAKAEGQAASAAAKAEGQAAASAAAKAEGQAASALAKAEGQAAAAEAEGQAASAAAKAEGQAAASAAAKAQGQVASTAAEAEGQAASGLAKAEGRGASAAESAVPPGGRKNYTYASSPGEDIATHMAGMPEGNISQIQRIANKTYTGADGVKYQPKILVRPTTSHAAEMLASGEGVPKPCYVKNKTINQLDVELGAKPANLGKVGHFEPKKLPPQGSMSDEEFTALKKRYAERLDEYNKQTTVLSQNKKVFVKDGVVYDTKTGRPLTGDHDIFDIVGADGRPLPPEVKAQILKDLQQPPFAAQHGAHMDWKYDHLDTTVPDGAKPGTMSDFQQAKNIDTKILEGHQVGGEPLITFAPGEPPQASYIVGKR